MIVTDVPIVAPWVMARTQCSIASDATVIGWVSTDGALTAGIMYEHWTGPTVTATLAFRPGSYVAKGFIRAIFAYPFKQLGCEQMLVFVAADNEDSVRFVKRLNFEELYAVPDVFEDNVAMVIYRLKRENCRFLEDENGQG